MTSSVKLRALEPEDLDLVYRIENDTSLWQWGANSVPVSRFAVRQYLENQHSDIFQDEQLRLVIEVDGTGIGLLDLSAFSPLHLRAEVGIVLLAEYQRQGYAAAALRQLHDYAANHLHLRSLYAYVGEDNLPAQQLFRTVGYQPSASLPRWIEGKHTATLFQILL